MTTNKKIEVYTDYDHDQVRSGWRAEILQRSVLLLYLNTYPVIPIKFIFFMLSG